MTKFSELITSEADGPKGITSHPKKVAPVKKPKLQTGKNIFEAASDKEHTKIGHIKS